MGSGEGRVSWRAVGLDLGWSSAWIGGRNPGGQGSGCVAEGWVFRCGVSLGAGGQIGWGVGNLPFAGLVWGCSLAQPEEWKAQQSRAVALQTYGVKIWQTGYYFIRSWHGEAFRGLSV
jgi:hypothetical protein